MAIPGARSPSSAKLMAIRWSPYVSKVVGWGRPGYTTNPSGSSSASMPHLCNSVTTAAIRFVSLPRMKPIPVTLVGPSANTATAAKVWAVSEQSAMSTVTPCNGPSARISISASSIRTVAPMRLKILANRISPWVEPEPNPAIRTDPPVIAAAPRK